MSPVSSQSADALMRGPIQGSSFSDIGPASKGAGSSGGASSGVGGGIASDRSESLKSFSGNKMDAPAAGGKIEKPAEGAQEMDKGEEAMSAIEALMQKFAEAQDMLK